MTYDDWAFHYFHAVRVAVWKACSAGLWCPPGALTPPSLTVS